MAKQIVLLLFVATCLACLESAEGYGYMRLTFTIENHYTGDNQEFSMTRWFDLVLSWPPRCRKCYYDILVLFHEMFPEFSFTAKENIYHGKLITHVNGLKGPPKTFWAVLRRTETEDCLVPLSITNYAPRHEEHLVLSLQPYSVFNTMPWCYNDTAHICTHDSAFCCNGYNIGC